MSTTNSILLIEDNEDDVFLMKRALKGAGITNQLRVLEDGQRAIDYFSGLGEFADRDQYPIPAIVFLDLKLPIKMGLDVLAWIRAREEFASLVVVVLTSSNESSDVKRAYGLGANSYVVKPPTADQLLDLAKAFKWYWLEFNRFDRVTL
ncbi:MAG: putative response regulator, CheY [Verrucomicrobiales bacterium]|nr:putative response regulator, CheY [Verrucomicrobiales bacterium]